MSLHGYHYSVKLSALDPPFESLIMAAMRKADTYNGLALQLAFPSIWKELQARSEAPAGIIPEDGIPENDLASVQRNIAQFNRKKL